MGLLGFGIGMGFRTMRYTARALTPRRRYYRRSCARQQQSDSDVAFGLIAIVFFLLVSVAAANGGSDDPTSKYGPPGRYGYGYTWDGHIVPLNSPPKPPGTYVDGHPAPIVVTFPAPRPAVVPAKPQPYTPAKRFSLVLTWLLVLGVPIVMARTIMHPRNRWNWLSAIAATAIGALWVSNVLQGSDLHKHSVNR